MSEEQLWSIPDDVESIYIHYTTEDLLKGFREEALRHREEIERLHSIIKEVREQINKDRAKNNYEKDSLIKQTFYCNKTDKLLEILDKENK